MLRLKHFLFLCLATGFPLALVNALYLNIKDGQALTGTLNEPKTPDKATPRDFSFEYTPAVNGGEYEISQLDQWNQKSEQATATIINPCKGTQKPNYVVGTGTVAQSQESDIYEWAAFTSLVLPDDRDSELILRFCCMNYYPQNKARLSYKCEKMSGPESSLNVWSLEHFLRYMNKMYNLGLAPPQ